MTQNNQKSLGQYMTVADDLQQFVYTNIRNTGPLLEPSFGRGHLLKKILESNPDYPMVCCELDASLKPIVSFNEYQTILYGDFLAHDFGDRRFKTIVGNPPYVKHISGNIYLQFIEKCYRLLDIGGELIFIVPSDFIRLTSAAKLIQEMYQHGQFTDWYFPHDEHLFEDANIDVVVFRYTRIVAPIQEQCMMNGQSMFCNMRNGILTFSNLRAKGTPLSDMFNVYVGMVSGKEDVFRVPFGTARILTDKDTIHNYIFTTKFPTDSPEINTHLLLHKTELMERKIRKMTESNWFEWGAPRNILAMDQHEGQQCIYIRNLTRKAEIAFKGCVRRFGGALLCLIPKTAMSHQQMDSIVLYLNSEEFKKEYIFSGRFKIGHKQVCNILLPS